jgi:hypothetical protein
MVKTLRLAIVIPMLCVAVFVAHTPRPAQAQMPLSALCATLSNLTVSPVTTSFSISGFTPFNVGEVVTVNHTGTAAFVVVEIPSGSTVGTVTMGSTASFVVGAGATSLAIRNTTGVGFIQGTIKCGLGPASSSSEVKFFDPGDDRLNRDPGQPAAVYCRNQGDVHIYEVNVDDSKGKIALVVTKAEIDAVVNANPAVNTLIKQSGDGKYKLFYLPATKELSFITNENGTGKQYSHVWKGLCR